jgi:hypothetical protein
LLERWSPARYGGRRFAEAAAMVATAKVKALLTGVLDLVEGVLDLVEHHVPVGKIGRTMRFSPSPYRRVYQPAAELLP